MTTNKNRQEWIDIAKGIGIILVVYGHVLRGVESANLPLDKNFFLSNDLFIYSFHMPLFFVLSGLFFTNSLNKYGVKGLLFEKSKTILYPFVIWSILQTSIEIILSSFTNGQISINELFTSLIIPRAQFWFLYALFFINVINLLLFRIFKDKWLIISFLISIIYHIFPINLSVFSNAFSYLIYFNIGIASYNFLIKENKINKISNPMYLISIVLSFIFFEYLYIAKDILILKKILILPILGTIVTIILSYVISKEKALKTILNSLGKYSMHIYILHILVASGTRIILFKLLHIDNVIIHIVTGTILGVIAPYLITFKFKNNKIYESLFRLK